jgi:hypothetical protein
MTFTLAPRPMTTPALFGFVALDLANDEIYFGIGATKSKAIVDASNYVDEALALDVIPSTARFAMAAAAESEMLPASDWHVYTDTDGQRVIDLRDSLAPVYAGWQRDTEAVVFGPTPESVIAQGALVARPCTWLLAYLLLRGERKVTLIWDGREHFDVARWGLCPLDWQITHDVAKALDVPALQVAQAFAYIA